MQRGAAAASRDKSVPAPPRGATPGGNASQHDSLVSHRGTAKHWKLHWAFCVHEWVYQCGWPVHTASIVEQCFINCRFTQSVDIKSFADFRVDNKSKVLDKRELKLSMLKYATQSKILQLIISSAFYEIHSSIVNGVVCCTAIIHGLAIHPYVF